MIDAKFLTLRARDPLRQSLVVIGAISPQASYANSRTLSSFAHYELRRMYRGPWVGSRGSSFQPCIVPRRIKGFAFLVRMMSSSSRKEFLVSARSPFPVPHSPFPSPQSPFPHCALPTYKSSSPYVQLGVGIPGKLILSIVNIRYLCG